MAVAAAPPAPGRAGPVDAGALLDAIGVGTVADADGRDHNLRALIAARQTTMLLFLSSQCSACVRVRQHIESGAGGSDLQFVALIDALDDAHQTPPGSALAVYLDSADIASANGIRAFPSAIVVDAELHPVSELLTGSTEIRRSIRAHQGALADA